MFFFDVFEIQDNIIGELLFSLFTVMESLLNSLFHWQFRMVGGCG